MEPIAIFAALRWECGPVLRHLRRLQRHRLGAFTAWHGVAAGCEVWLMKTGVGPERAAAAAGALHAGARVGLYVSTGCAGALAPELAPGDLAVATAVIGHPSGARFDTDAGHRERACGAAERAALRAVLGPVLCSSAVLATAAAKRAAAAAHGTVAVEMEGAPIAAQAARAGVPFVSVRAILDAAATELPHAGRFTQPERGTLKPLALAGYLAAHPAALPELLAVQRLRRAAERSLETFFGAWFAAPR